MRTMMVWIAISLGLSAAFLFLPGCSDDVAGLPSSYGGGTTQNEQTAGGGSPTTPGGTGGKSSAPASGLPCDVDAVLKESCQSCHGTSPSFGASAPLVTLADLQKIWTNGKKVSELVAERIKSDTRPMPPPPNKRLEAKDVATLDNWIKAGTPASQDRCEGDGGPAGKQPKPLSCTPDLKIRASRPFVMQQGAPLDQYVCVGFDVNLTQKRHVIAAAPHVDNTKILHHILLFQSPKAESSEPTSCAAFGSASWKLIGGWAPGGDNLELPPQAGFPEEKGTTHWVLQLHYNNALNVPGQQDLSGFDLCTTEQLRQYDAGVVAFGSINFKIPPRASYAITCDYTLPQDFRNVKFFSASAHMHKLGTAMSTHRLPGGANGAPEKVLDVNPFDFENQSGYVTQNAVNPGDVIRTRCAWKNTTDKQVGFGEGTSDEMCFDFVGYYPNIPDRTFLGLPIFTWITPSQSARCTATN
jgi:hypothetical protein